MKLVQCTQKKMGTKQFSFFLEKNKKLQASTNKGSFLFAFLCFWGGGKQMDCYRNPLGPLCI